MINGKTTYSETEKRIAAYILEKLSNSDCNTPGCIILSKYWNEIFKEFDLRYNPFTGKPITSKQYEEVIEDYYRHK